MKIVIMSNPNTGNDSLDFGTRALYCQVLFKRQNILATSMADLAEPARVEPCMIRTIGSPYQAPLIRLSDTHLQFVRQEMQTC